MTDEEANMEIERHRLEVSILVNDQCHADDENEEGPVGCLAFLALIVATTALFLA